MSKSDIFIYICFELKFNQTSVNRWRDSLIKDGTAVHLPYYLIIQCKVLSHTHKHTHYVLFVLNEANGAA